MRRVRRQVTAESLLRRAVEVVVGRDQLLELSLDVDEFREVVLDERDASGGEILNEANLARVQDEEGLSLAVGATGGTANTVDVVSGLIGGVELDNPVYGWDLGCVSICRRSFTSNCSKGWGKRTSRPRAATSVQISTPSVAFTKLKKFAVRFCCFCWP